MCACAFWFLVPCSLFLGIRLCHAQSGLNLDLYMHAPIPLHEHAHMDMRIVVRVQEHAPVGA
jgi:hypothetical protein